MKEWELPSLYKMSPLFPFECQVEVFWVVTPCNIVIGHQHFRRSCCLHLHCH